MRTIEKKEYHRKFVLVLNPIQINQNIIFSSPIDIYAFWLDSQVVFICIEIPEDFCDAKRARD